MRRLFTTSALAGGLCLLALPAPAVPLHGAVIIVQSQTGSQGQTGAQTQTAAAPAPAGAAGMQSDKQKSIDETIDDRVEFKLETSDLVRKYNVHTKVEDGVVTLSGDVATAAQKAEAERLARSVEGVVRVQNDITIDPDEDKSMNDRIKSGLNKTGDVINDAWITTKVKWFLARDEGLRSVTSIDVDTKDHVVTLKGTVRTAAEKARAVELANKADGVKRVIDQLTIK
jgi:osmotically-inducible protein OsmY